MSSSLLSLTSEEWEDLCDGCGRCCLVKLEDEDDGSIHYTNVACRYLDSETCRCSDYSNRKEINPRCMVLSKDNLATLALMPYTCAYRLMHEDRKIEVPVNLLTIAGMAVSEEYIHDDQLQNHLIDWVNIDDESV